jgi:hypothetical protein
MQETEEAERIKEVKRLKQELLVLHNKLKIEEKSVDKARALRDEANKEYYDKLEEIHKMSHKYAKGDLVLLDNFGARIHRISSLVGIKRYIISGVYGSAKDHGVWEDRIICRVESDATLNYLLSEYNKYMKRLDTNES